MFGSVVGIQTVRLIFTRQIGRNKIEVFSSLNIFFLILPSYQVVHDLHGGRRQEVDGEGVAQSHREVAQDLLLASTNSIEKSLENWNQR